LFELGRADAAHADQIRDPAKPSDLLSMLDDSPRDHRPDARQSPELSHRCPIQIHQRSGTVAGTDADAGTDAVADAGTVAGPDADDPLADLEGLARSKRAAAQQQYYHCAGSNRGRRRGLGHEALSAGLPSMLSEGSARGFFELEAVVKYDDGVVGVLGLDEA
jgi:hypothetical protein